MRHARAVLASVVIAASAVALFATTRPPPVAVPHPVAAARPPTMYLDVSSRHLAGALLAIARHMDGKLIPDRGAPSTMGDGVTPAPAKFTTTHETWPSPDCHDPSHYVLPLRPKAAAEWTALRAACAAKADAGGAGVCAEVVAAPALVTTITWAADDDGPCWWETNPGVPAMPPDDYEGQSVP